ncbi:GPP34 family phosphoprotein [Aureivirga marina]|uniref:GPP34 family phosphoprotein n=1 Tax=Aureivirga marina TaxID=1182451 RepID=UPI0018C92D92|nr:GPP34 family phosphoprotein [Aureivirga marina]
MELGTREKLLLLKIQANKRNYYSSFKVLERTLLLFEVLEMFRDKEFVLEQKRITAGKFISENARKKIFFEMVKNATRKRKLYSWVERFYRKKNQYVEKSLQILEREKIIKIEKAKILNLFPSKKIELLKPNVKIQLVNSLENIIVNGKVSDKETILLLRELDNKFYYQVAFEAKDWRERSKLRKQNRKMLKKITMEPYEKVVNDLSLHLSYNGFA